MGSSRRVGKASLTVVARRISHHVDFRLVLSAGAHEPESGTSGLRSTIRAQSSAVSPSPSPCGGSDCWEVSFALSLFGDTPTTLKCSSSRTSTDPPASSWSSISYAASSPPASDSVTVPGPAAATAAAVACSSSVPVIAVELSPGPSDPSSPPAAAKAATVPPATSRAPAAAAVIPMTRFLMVLFLSSASLTVSGEVAEARLKRTSEVRGDRGACDRRCSHDRRELHDHQGPAEHRILFDADRAAVRVDDLRHDREPESAAATGSRSV